MIEIRNQKANTACKRNENFTPTEFYLVEHNRDKIHIYVN